MKRLQISIRGARIEKNMTQKQAAEKMSVTKETISNWERGKTAPTGLQLMELCKIYGVDISDIFLPDKLA